MIGTVDGAYQGHRIYPPGWISLRITKPTRALLGMQQFTPLSAMIEVVLLTGRLHSDYILTPPGGFGGDDVSRDAFASAVLRIEKAMLDWGGILHWGQLNDLMDESGMTRFPSGNIRAWKAARRTLCPVPYAATFSNLMTRRLGLDVPPRS